MSASHSLLSWTLLLAKAVYYTFTHPHSRQDIDGRVPELYDSVRWPMLVFQTAALLEVSEYIVMKHCSVYVFKLSIACCRWFTVLLVSQEMKMIRPPSLSLFESLSLPPLSLSPFSLPPSLSPPSLSLSLPLSCFILYLLGPLYLHTHPLGIVSSGVVTTLMQVYSRVFVVWAIVELTPGVADNIGLLIVCYAWGITEVIRYSYYFFALVDAVPYIIKWCRCVYCCFVGSLSQHQE